jgi:anti-sigma regulatory factor (Ser/Thr protein kinase)
MPGKRGSGGKARGPAFSFKLDKDLGELSQMLVALEEFAETHGVSPLQTQRITLSVDELVTNIIKYGTKALEHTHIHLWATIAGDTFHIEIEDHGVPFDPFHEAPVPDTTLPLEERPIGGLGVFLVQSLMTSTNYERIKDRNRITLTRSLTASGQEEAQ